MILKVGTFDMTPYIAHGGVKYSRNDVDGSSAGRGIDGTLIRDRVGIKDKLEVTLIPLTTEQCAAIFAAIEPEFVTVQFTSPRQGAVVTKTMYSNNIPVTYAMRKTNGTELWSGITFPLVEK